MPEESHPSLIDDVERLLGPWGPFWEELSDRDPERLRSIVDYARVTGTTSHIGERDRHLILLGAAASLATIDRAAIAVHARNALRAGATPDQLRDILHAVTSMGCHAYFISLPALQETLRSIGAT
jgi:alkylhydroperoxidase/carboxymuconolactone decarboxylase family protein YurZ